MVMNLAHRAGALALLAIATAAAAADMLPLKQGIYVPVTSACKGASNAEIVNYWGGDSSIGVAQAECKIKKLAKTGTAYTVTDECRDIQSGELIEGGPTVLAIEGPTRFSMGGTDYKYCGTKVQF
jgi:hypothetical protein